MSGMQSMWQSACRTPPEKPGQGRYLDVQGGHPLRHGQPHGKVGGHADLPGAEVGVGRDDGAGRKVDALAHHVLAEQALLLLQDLPDALPQAGTPLSLAACTRTAPAIVMPDPVPRQGLALCLDVSQPRAALVQGLWQACAGSGFRLLMATGREPAAAGARDNTPVPRQHSPRRSCCRTGC